MLSPTMFSGRMKYMRASEIRELLKVTEKPEIISFGGGLPAPELFPIQELYELTAELILKQGAKALQYSTTEGHTPLRQKIADRMDKIFGVSLSVKDILISCGSQQALDLIGKVFIDQGDDVFLESPSYLGAINAFRAYEPNFVEVATDDDGMLPEALEAALKSSKRPKLLYMVPDFQNPSGRTWSLERRKALVSLAERYGIVVVEDNPYGELRFEGSMLPSVKSLDKSGLVIYLGTFSKTLCPGMRIGWIAASAPIMEKLVLVKQGADLHTSTTSQMQIDLFLERYDLDSHIEVIRREYKKRRDTLLGAMERYFNTDISFTRPMGGLFTWAQLPEGMDSRLILAKAIEQNVAFVPGGSFFPCNPRHNTMRLNFSNMPEDRIVEGIERLSKVLRQMRP
ncbi:MAG: PLP-dependent aminotransferase family protein [Clostridia bacterium]|nr:PLP-dependent aminotransferase family protein [Clostridia bacterium]